MTTFEENIIIFGEENLRTIALSKISSLSGMLDRSEDRLYTMKKKSATCKSCDDVLYEIGTDRLEAETQRYKSKLWGWRIKKKILDGEELPNCSYDLDEIKRTVLISSLMPQKPTLTAPNREFYPCPLHNETKPSFVVYLKDNSFHCFGCKEHGDVIALHMKLEGLDFKSSIKSLSNNV